MYLDTSVLAKLYVREPLTERAVALVAGQQLCSSWLATVELQSVLLRLEREGKISPENRLGAWNRWHRTVSLGYYQLIPLNEHVLSRAWKLMAECHPIAPLRTLDAIHLASYEELEAGPLATTDKQMIAAARHLGFELATI